MQKTLNKISQGYRRFREKYAIGEDSIMQNLASQGQAPEIMVLACCDSRVDPALILQCDPGDLFTARNVANIVPPFETMGGHHGTSAALEFGVCYLNVKHLIILGHSQCGGISALLQKTLLKENDFISQWVSIIGTGSFSGSVDEYAQQALFHSYQNCLTFPWIEERVNTQKLTIHLWYFDIKKGEILSFSFEKKQFLTFGNDPELTLTKK